MRWKQLSPGDTQQQPMVDQDVQSILQEIRERVRAGEPELADQIEPPAVPSSQSESNGRAPTDVVVTNHYAGLSTMARAWNRLPPLVSNRSGTTAKLELWIKACIKRAIHWITWEQVNFNASVHHTLREIVESLAVYEQGLANYQQRLADYERQLRQLHTALESKLELSQVQPQLQVLKQEIGQQINANQAELCILRDDMVDEIQARYDSANLFESELKSIRSEIAGHRQEITDIAETQLLELVARCEGLQNQRNEVASELLGLKSRLEAMEEQNNTQTQAVATHRSVLQAQLSDLLAELRERDERLLDEQRVCFRQLSLEAGEVAVIQDRVRRELEARVEKLETGNSSKK